MCYFVIAGLAGAGVLLWLVRNAPEGYEDETGFHYGPKPAEDENKNFHYGPWDDGDNDR